MKIKFAAIIDFEVAKVCAVSAVISELRAHGHDIACWRQGDRWFYRLDVRRKAA